MLIPLCRSPNDPSSMCASCGQPFRRSCECPALGSSRFPCYGSCTISDRRSSRAGIAVEGLDLADSPAQCQPYSDVDLLWIDCEQVAMCRAGEPPFRIGILMPGAPGIASMPGFRTCLVDLLLCRPHDSFLHRA